MSPNPDGWFVLEPMLRMLVTTGALFAPDGATKVKAAASDAVRPPEETTTSAGPGAGCSPVVALISPLLTITVADAATPPIVTVASGAKSAPLMITGVPPVLLPDCGEMDVTRN